MSGVGSRLGRGWVAVALAWAACAPSPAVAAASTPAAFRTPVTVQAVELTGDTPAAIFYLPKEPAAVIRDVARWLSGATEVAVRMPQGPPVMLMDYLGPAQLHLVVYGRRVTLAPAHYLTDTRGRISVTYLPDTVSYTEGSDGTPVYLKSRALYRFLRRDAAWKAQFAMMGYTDAQRRAVTSALRGRSGVLADFPRPVGTRVLSLGGLPATLETRVLKDGRDTVVVLTAAWRDGAAAHTWRFTIGPRGALLGLRQSGQTPPS